METTLLLTKAGCDDRRITSKVVQDLNDFAQIVIWKAPENMENENDSIYGLFIEYGKDKSNTLAFRLSIDDLEMFAHSVLKSIEMVRRDYSEMIKARLIERMHI